LVINYFFRMQEINIEKERKEKRERKKERKKDLDRSEKTERTDKKIKSYKTTNYYIYKYTRYKSNFSRTTKISNRIIYRNINRKTN